MCIAVYKKEGIELFDYTLRTCWDANSDGAGFMYAENDKLHIQKGFFTFEDFMEAYEPHKQKQVVLHFRIRTHGDIDFTNCHPYTVDNQLAFVHNGTIRKAAERDKSKSDTWHFNEDMVKPLRTKYKNFYRDEIIQELMHEYIGWSKLIFLDNKGNHAIVNENAGVWDSDCWFSNTSFRRYIPQVKEKVQAHQPLDFAQNWLTTNDDYLVGNIKDKTESDGSIIHSGTVCWLNKDTISMKYGTYVVVKYVYADNTVGIYSTMDPKKEARVHISALVKTSIEKTDMIFKRDQLLPDDIAMFDDNWNHFRVGDDVIVQEIRKEHAVVVDGISTKEYIVPLNKLVRLDNVLLEDL